MASFFEKLITCIYLFIFYIEHYVSEDPDQMLHFLAFDMGMRFMSKFYKNALF